MKKILVGAVLITALLVGCKKKEETTQPQNPKPPSSPAVPSPTIKFSFPTIDTSQAPDTADQFVAMAADYSNSTIEILNSVSDSMRFDFSNPPEPRITNFEVANRVVITWDSAGVTFKLVIVTDPGIVRETLYVNGTEQGTGITFNNFILVDVSVDYQVVGSDTFGSGMFNFYIVKDSTDMNWDNSDPQFNGFWMFYVQSDTIDYLMAIDTLHVKGGPHDKDFIILNVFGADHPNDYIHVGYAFFNWIFYHIKDYYSDTLYDELDFAYNPAMGGPVTVSMPHNPYQVIPKLRKLKNMIKNNVKLTSAYDGWYYGLRFEINPLYKTSADTARVYWDEPNDGETLPDIPVYPDGPFSVPPFDVLIEW